MPVPYSDNLYSALDDGDDDEYTPSHTDHPTVNTDSNTQDEQNGAGNDQPNEDEALSPSDGYFHASDATAYEPPSNRQSANVPNVPNVLVDDPTLHDDDRDTKTREAENERRLSNMAALQDQQAPFQSPGSPTGQQVQSPIATSSRPGHIHRRSVDEDQDLDQFHDNSGHTSSSPSVSQHRRQDHQQQRHSQPNITSPLFQQQPIDAPPAYTPSAPSQSQGDDASPRSPSSTNSAGLGYQTFGSPPATAGDPMGVPSEHQRLLGSGREPESMGGVPGDQPPQTFWQRLRRAFSFRDGREKLRKFLKWLLVFVIIISIVSGFSLFGEHSMHKQPKVPMPPENPEPDPVEPEDPRKPARPPVGGGDPDNGNHDDLTWKPRSYCHQPDSMFRLATNFDPRFISSNSLTVIQELIKTDNPSQRQPHIEGEVVLRRSPDASPYGEIVVEMISNQRDFGQASHITYDSSNQKLVVGTPRSVEWPYSSGPCLQMRITVYAPENSALENLSVHTTQLNIDVVKGLDLWVQNDALLQTVSGDISTPKPQSGNGQDEESDPYAISKRRTIVKTISGDIKGFYALNDLLQVDSISGTISIVIAPKEVDPEIPSPAKLIISTKSGDVTAEEPIDLSATVTGETSSSRSSSRKRSFPARDYVVDINSISGTIHAALAFSSSANVHSQSSTLKLKLLPILDPSADSTRSRPTLETKTKSGDTQLVLLDPIWTGILQPNDQRLIGPGRGDDDKDGEDDEEKDPWIIIHPDDILVDTHTTETRAFGNLNSHHGSISGTIKLHYPSSWEGGLRVETISGTQKVKGEGLDLYDVSNPVTRTVMGRKGKGTSDLKVSTVSGTEDVFIGKVSS